MKTTTATLAALVIAFLITGCEPSPSAESPVGPADREYRLEALMIGYIGQGGDIDGVKNPVLRAHRGETVTLIIVNGERMVHDIALRRHRLRSDTILEKGATTHLTFVAEFDDTYYCTIPGHVEAGMAGEFQLMDRSSVRADNDP